MMASARTAQARRIIIMTTRCLRKNPVQEIASYRPVLTDFGSDSRGARVIDRLQGIKRRLRQVGHGPGDAPEQDDALLVGDRSDGIDELRRRLLSEITGEERTNFI